MISVSKRIARAAVLASALLAGGCATSYQSSDWTGGFSEQEISADMWRIQFAGNGYTTKETVQTYWLYHCAEFALSKGYDGFEILTPVQLSVLDRLPQAGVGLAGVIRVGHSGGSARTVMIYGGGGALVDKPAMTASIRLLKRPFTPLPARRFEAAALKALLEPYVTGPKCGGNVCPHVHGYLYPDPAAQKVS